jgi:hypothetical protein
VIRAGVDTANQVREVDMNRAKLVVGQSVASAMLLVAVTLGIVAAPTVSAQPKIRLAEETFDFGFTPEGLPVSHRYWLYSAGTDSLVIKKVRPMCGCTTVPLPKKLLLPGDSVPLDVTFDPKRFSGRVEKSVAITSNDTSAAELRIRFMATVGKELGQVLIEPRMIYLDTLGKDSQAIVLQNVSDAPYRLTMISMPPPFLSIDPAAAEIPPGGQVTLVLKTGKDTPLGQYNGSVTFRCDGPQPHMLTVPIMGTGYAH